MAKVFRRRINSRKMTRRFLIILFLALLIFNLDSVGRFFTLSPTVTLFHTMPEFITSTPCFWRRS